MPSIHNLVILFTRYPQPGKCKTRLIPALGEKGALRTHRQLVTHILLELNTFLCIQKTTAFHIYYDGGNLQQMKEWLGNSMHYQEQQGDDLGQRMANALQRGLQTHHNTILIGSDCPAIDADLLEEAFAALHHSDIVLGPAHDGGYYLIGIANRCKDALWRELFNTISWSTDKVLSQTLVQAEKYQLHPHILKQLHDIDTAEDLKYFHHRSHSQ